MEDRMPLDYPLVFQPVFRRYLWGGRNLGEKLHKPIGNEGSDWAESWEVVDHGADQSVVALGPHAGQSLHDLVTAHGRELFGRHYPQRQFPLLFKYLDARLPLSVQVHPNDAYAQKMTKPDLGKTEAWLVVGAEPGSLLYAGLKAGVDRAALAQAVADGTTEDCLHIIEAQPGDCIFIPAGVPHALGAGLVIAEIQQASDTTFRLFDWNRVGPDGQPRALHIEQALDVIDYDFGPVAPQTPQATDRPHAQRLVACDKFVLDRWEMSREDAPQTLGGDDRFHIISVLEGEARLALSGSSALLQIGETTLLPAAAGAAQVTTSSGARLLDMYLP
jgi:mannose-6-phosphate isomerase